MKANGLKHFKGSAPYTTLQPSVQDRLQNVASMTAPAEKRSAISSNTPTKTALLVGDSNTRFLEPSRLHDEKKVVKESRMTLEQAFSNVPKLPQPENVSDVVLLTGINDIKQPNANIHETVEKVDQVCRLYSNSFPNAKIHIGSVVPTNEKHIKYNTELKNLAEIRQTPFIPADGMFDRDTGRLRPNMIKGIHFTPKGLSTFAKDIKRSLYGNYKPRPKHFSNFETTNQPAQSHLRPPMPYAVPSLQNQKDPRQEMSNCLKMAISCLENM